MTTTTTETETAEAGENLELLHKAFDALVRADNRSLRAAYYFGQVIDALHSMDRRTYTYGMLGDEVNRSDATVALYARLFRKYNRVEDLLRTALRARTFAIAALAGSDEALAARYGWKCGNCGSWDVRRRRMSDADVAAAMAEKSAREALAVLS